MQSSKKSAKTSSSKASSSKSSSQQPASGAGPSRTAPRTTPPRTTPPRTTPPRTTPRTSPDPPQILRLIVMRRNDGPQIASLYHWGLLLVNQSGTQGELFHTARGGGGQLKASADRCCTYGTSGYNVQYDHRPSYDPTRSSRRQVHAQHDFRTRASSAVIDNICQRVQRDFPYSIFGANCQYFSIRVLHQLVLEGHISQNDFDAVASMAVFNESLLAKWSNIRSTPSLPPL